MSRLAQGLVQRRGLFSEGLDQRTETGFGKAAQAVDVRCFAL
jgi:hypothetical protein